jgi:hypothetical protein
VLVQETRAATELQEDLVAAQKQHVDGGDDAEALGHVETVVRDGLRTSAPGTTMTP